MRCPPCGETVGSEDVSCPKTEKGNVMAILGKCASALSNLLGALSNLLGLSKETTKTDAATHASKNKWVYIGTAGRLGLADVLHVLRTNGIDASAPGGSRGFPISVPRADAARAQNLLKQHVHKNHFCFYRPPLEGDQLFDLGESNNG